MPQNAVRTYRSPQWDVLCAALKGTGQYLAIRRPEVQGEITLVSPVMLDNRSNRVTVRGTNGVDFDGHFIRQPSDGLIELDRPDHAPNALPPPILQYRPRGLYTLPYLARGLQKNHVVFRLVEPVETNEQPGLYLAQTMYVPTGRQVYFLDAFGAAYPARVLSSGLYDIPIEFE